MARKLLGLLAMLIFLTGGIYLYQSENPPQSLHTPAPPTAASFSFKNVRVGFLKTESTIRNEADARHFTGQYLTELAKYLPWTYELVGVTPEEALYKLHAGEIELLLPAEIFPRQAGQLVYTQRQFYLSAMGLYTRQHEKHFNPRDLSTLDGVSVGLYKDRPGNQLFRDFCQENNLQMQMHFFDDQKSLLAALRKGDVDLVVDSPISVTSEEKPLVSFGILKTHVAALPQNKNLLEDLDKADTQLIRDNPDYVQHLEITMRESLRPFITNYTPAESTFIRTSPPLKVAFYNEAPPYVTLELSLDRVHGIYPDILRLLSSYSGFSFEFLHYTSYEDARQALRKGEADIMMDAYSAHMKDYDHYLYSSPILHQEFSFIGPTAVRDIPDLKAEHHTLALVENKSLAGLAYLQHEFPQWTIRQYGSTDECLEAVKRKEADYALVDKMKLEADRSLLMYPGLSTFYATGTSVPVCFTISRNKNPMLKRVLDKSLLRLPAEELNQILDRHRLAEKPQLSISYAMSHYPLQTGLSLGLFLLMVATIGYFIHHTRRERKQREILTQTNKEFEDTLEALWEAQKSRDAYKEKAETDALTGVLNKAAMEDFAQSSLNRLTYGKKVTDALIIADLDHFKEANDTHGHQYGDDILRDFAHALIRLTRKGDGVGRFGGDEFLIYLRNIPPSALPDFARRIMAAAHSLDPTQRPPLSASIGITIINRPGLTYEDIFHQADQALYKVKEAGRDSYRIHGK